MLAISESSCAPRIHTLRSAIFAEHRLSCTVMYLPDRGLALPIGRHPLEGCAARRPQVICQCCGLGCGAAPSRIESSASVGRKSKAHSALTKAPAYSRHAELSPQSASVLPDHLHCLWTLPQGDADFPGRWRAIKIEFVKGLPAGEPRSQVMAGRGERGIWQRRYWEHTIRDDRDFAAHMDYTNFNPVKHGLVTHPADWPYSSFRRRVDSGLYPRRVEVRQR
jgi:REP element-mobilizing transposase RayT